MVSLPFVPGREQAGQRPAIVIQDTSYGVVRTEIVCANGTALVGHQQRHRLAVYTPAGATHDLFPGFLERFADAYREELADFVRGAPERRPPAGGECQRGAVARHRRVGRRRDRRHR